MSDPNKFINTYIDTVIAALHEQLGSGLQLKTQLKLANDHLQEKDGVIAQLTSEIEAIKNNQENINSAQAELASCNDRLRIAEESHAALKVKVSHMDTLTKQLADMKNEIKVRDEIIATITNDLNTKDAHISSLNSTILEKDNELARLQGLLNEKENDKPTIKSEKTKSTSKESSTVKVQLNTKSKPKELPIDDDF